MAAGMILALLSITPDIWGDIVILVLYPLFAFTMGYAFRIWKEQKKVKACP